MELKDSEDEENFQKFDKVTGNILVMTHEPRKIIDVTKDNDMVYYLV
jgi:uncharacterized protein YjiK